MRDYKKLKKIILSFASLVLVGGGVFTLFLVKDKKYASDDVELSVSKGVQNESQQITQVVEDNRYNITSNSSSQEGTRHVSAKLTEDGRYYIFSDSPSKEETRYVIKDFFSIKEGMTFSQVYDILDGRKANKATMTSGVSPQQVYELIEGGEVFIAYREDKVSSMRYYKSESGEKGIDLLSEDCTLWDKIP